MAVWLLSLIRRWFLRYAEPSSAHLELWQSDSQLLFGNVGELVHAAFDQETLEALDALFGQRDEMGLRERERERKSVLLLRCCSRWFTSHDWARIHQ